jgi:hypothetical protein
MNRSGGIPVCVLLLALVSGCEGQALPVDAAPEIPRDGCSGDAAFDLLPVGAPAHDPTHPAGAPPHGIAGPATSRC